ncbi:ATP-binding protein [Anseongella ginsenosidimutans]|uniref:ATP-binding protein n=1 Tax=Anseongella ginsenosidimutans TaxID=496056 RepID=UPI00104C3695|nr:ATP-binding protein [Anseongella ginsenosidimutans]QEC53882.1 hypothetical protein FRZ59_17135 [Anseongella ginsenosidimutans]
MKTPTNPFVLSGYYGKKWFCDREEELTILMKHLQNERNVVLYSWRRMGKTALIRRIFEEAKRHNETESVYVDLLATQDLKEAVRAWRPKQRKYGPERSSKKGTCYSGKWSLLRS